jgi:hypothetical protein
MLFGVFGDRKELRSVKAFVSSKMDRGMHDLFGCSAREILMRFGFFFSFLFLFCTFILGGSAQRWRPRFTLIMAFGFCWASCELSAVSGYIVLFLFCVIIEYFSVVLREE